MANLVRLAVVALVVASVLTAGCSQARTLPPAWKGRDLTQPGWNNGTLRVGYSFVLEYVWSSGKTVQWDWLTNGTTILYFQVVRMENGQQVPLVGQHRDQSSGRLTVPQGGQYDIIFRNEDNSDAAFWYKVPEGSSPRLYAPGEGPGCSMTPLPVPPVPPGLPPDPPSLAVPAGAEGSLGAPGGAATAGPSRSC